MGFRRRGSYSERLVVYDDRLWRESCVQVHVKTNILEDPGWFHFASDVCTCIIAGLLQIKVKADYGELQDLSLISDGRRELVPGMFRCE